MSEKIIIRNKLVSKLESKMDDLTKSIQLLTKIDKKLFLKQSGGTYGLQQMGVNLAYLQSRAEMMKSVNSNNDALKRQLETLKLTVDNYNKIITDISNNLVSGVVSMNDINTKFEGLSDSLREQIYETLYLPFDKKTYDESNRAQYLNKKADEIIEAIKREVSDHKPLLDLFSELFNKNTKEGEEIFKGAITRVPSRYGSISSPSSRSGSPTRLHRSSSSSSLHVLPNEPEEGSLLNKYKAELDELNDLTDPTQDQKTQKEELKQKISSITELRKQYAKLFANTNKTKEEENTLKSLYSDLVKNYIK